METLYSGILVNSVGTVMDIDRATISWIINNGDEGLVRAHDFAIDEQLFDGEAKKVWLWMVDFYKEHGRVPGVDAFSMYHPNYTLVPTTEPLSFYADSLKKKFAFNVGSTAIEAYTKALTTGVDPLSALEFLRNGVRQVDDLVMYEQDVDWAATYADRLKLYQKMKGHGGVDGFSTLFPGLDIHTQGHHGGELIGIVARQNVGKTWAEVFLADHDWSEGRSPIVFSNEMAIYQIARRLDARHFRLGYQRLRSGRLSLAEEERWAERIKEYEEEQRPRFMIVGEGGGTVSKVAAKIQRYRPQTVYIDGMYLIEDERKGTAQHERIINVARDLKRLARRENIPIAVTMQFNKQASRTKGTADDIGLADVAKEFDIIYGLFQDEDQRLNGLMYWKLLKLREGEIGAQVEVLWDLKTMEVGQLGEIEVPASSSEEAIAEF